MILQTKGNSKMTEPKTIEGYIALIKRISKWTVSDKKGFDKLPLNVQQALLELSGAIENRLPDLENETPNTS